MVQEMIRRQEQKEAQGVTGMKGRGVMTGAMATNRHRLREVMRGRKASLLRW